MQGAIFGTAMFALGAASHAQCVSLVAKLRQHLAISGTVAGHSGAGVQ